MNSKTVYQTNHLGLYIGPIEADESPMEPGVWLIPAGCVQIPPPEHVPEFKAPRWEGKNWELVDFFDGLIVYNTTNRKPLTITGPGPIPNGFTTKKPGPHQIWKNGRWVDDLDTTLNKLYQEKVESLRGGYASYIGSGFSCNTLGEAHRYGSSLEDQVDLNGMILSLLNAVCPCSDSEGKNDFREHTAEQLHHVGQTLVLFKQRALQHADELNKSLDQTLADKDLAAMKAIKWSSPA